MSKFNLFIYLYLFNHTGTSIVEVCCCTKCYTEPVAPETSPVYSCYLSKLGIKFGSNSNSVYHLLLLPECLPCIVKLRCTR